MTEVVDLDSRRREKLAYWKCDCGCMTHYVRNDGELQCGRCDIIIHGVGFWRLPDCDDPPRADGENDPPTYLRADVGEPEDAMAETLSFVKVGPTAAIVVLFENGTLRVWGKEFKTRARRGWLRRRLDEARKMLVEQ